jgi:ankyrin repeat protein
MRKANPTGSDKRGQRLNVYEERELYCPICYDILFAAYETNCGHCFCGPCLEKSLQVCVQCPICRQQIEFIHPSFIMRKVVDSYLQKSGLSSRISSHCHTQLSKLDRELKYLLEKQKLKLKRNEKRLTNNRNMKKVVLWVTVLMFAAYCTYQLFSPLILNKNKTKSQHLGQLSNYKITPQSKVENIDTDNIEGQSDMVALQLCNAAAQGDVERVKEAVLAHGANVNYRGCARDEKHFPLFLASRGGHEETTATLLRLGAQVDLKTSDNSTALFIASELGRYPIVKLLVESGANINLPSRNGATALLIAAQNGHERIVDYLCFNNQQKPNLYASDESSMTALHVAAANGHFSTVETLLRCGVNVNVQTLHYGFTPLYMAARGGHANVVNLLLDNGADVTITSTEKATPLYVAAEYGRRDVVNILANQSRLADVYKHNMQIRQKALATIETPMYTGATPVLIACQKGFVDIATLLLRQGASPESAGAKGLRALHLAVIEGFTDVVFLLLEYGADPNARDDAGYTALHYAVMKGRRDLITPLLRYGADWTLRDAWGRNSLQLAETYDLKKLFRGVEKIACEVIVIGENRMLSVPMTSISTLKELKSRIQCLEGRKVLYIANEENLRYDETQKAKFFKYLTRKSELTVNVKFGASLRLKK